VGPGEEAEVPVTVPVPAEAGTYGLRFDLVDEDVIWFSQAGSPPLDVVLEAMDADEDRSYRAAIHVLPDGAATRLPAGSRTRLQLRIENVGRAAWPRAERLATGAIRVGAQLLDAAGKLIDLDYVRADLPRSVAPGEAGEMRLEFKLPSQPGRYTVKVDLVQEQLCWFEQRGSRPLLIDCEATAGVPDSTAPGMLRAHLELVQPKAPDVRVSPGEAIEVHILARNLGDTLWRHAEGHKQGHVRLGAMLVSRDGTHDYWRASLPDDVQPDDMAEIRASMPAPTTLGEYTVVLDLVDEGVAWFQHEGSPVVSFQMRVAAADTPPEPSRT
jgi:uncharacterized protein (DUF3820 family)